MGIDRRFVALLTIVCAGSIIVFFAGYRWLPTPKNIALFSGPPEFIVLSLIVALGLYLRQVNLHARELQEKIRDGAILTKPHEKLYVMEKMQQLENTSRTIMTVSPFVIFLMLIVGFRIAADDVCRFFYDEHHVPRVLYGFDLVIATGLFTMLSGLAVAHFRSRRHDLRIRGMIRSEEIRETLGP